MRISRHLTYANVAATLALLFAMSGGALAATHYLINSTRQINPKVLKQLRSTGPRGLEGPAGREGGAGKEGERGKEGKEGKEGKQGKEGKEGPQGKEGTTVLDRVRSSAALTSESNEKTMALTGDEWTQGATEAEQFVGSVTITKPPEAECNEELPEAGRLIIDVFLDGEPFGERLEVSDEASEKTETKRIDFTAGLVDTGAAVKHKIEVGVQDTCGVNGGAETKHFLVSSASIDVLGAH